MALAIEADGKPEILIKFYFILIKLWLLGDPENLNPPNPLF